MEAQWSGLFKVTQLISVRIRIQPEFCLPSRHHDFSASLYCCQRIFIWLVLKTSSSVNQLRHLLNMYWRSLCAMLSTEDKMNKTCFFFYLENHPLARASSPVTKTHSNIITSYRTTEDEASYLCLWSLGGFTEQMVFKIGLEK